MGSGSSLTLPDGEYSGRRVTTGILKYWPSPLKIDIVGDNPINATIRGNDLTIMVTTNSHGISIFGNNNIVMVSGTNVRLRIEGTGISISGAGETEIGVHSSSTSTIKFEDVVVVQLDEDQAPPIMSTKLDSDGDDFNENADIPENTVRYAYLFQPNNDNNNIPDMQDGTAQDSVPRGQKRAAEEPADAGRPKRTAPSSQDDSESSDDDEDSSGSEDES